MINLALPVSQFQTDSAAIEHRSLKSISYLVGNEENVSLMHLWLLSAGLCAEGH